MKNSRHATLRPDFLPHTGLFLLLLYLYVWLIVDPRVIHHGVGILQPYYSFSFTSGWTFALEHLARPGGLIEYGTKVLSPFFSYGRAGALIITTAAWITCLSVDDLLRLSGRPPSTALRVCPSVLILIAYAGYRQPLQAILSLVTVLVFFGTYVRLPIHGRLKWLAVVLTIYVSLNHIVGPDILFMAIMIAAYEVLVRSKKRTGLVALALGLCVPGLLAVTIYGIPVSKAYAILPVSLTRTTSERLCLVALALYFPCVLAGSALYGPLVARKGRSRPDHRNPSRRTAAARFFRVGESSRGIQTVAVFLIAGLVAWFALDRQHKIILQADYFCAHQRWDEALAAAEKMPSSVYNARLNRSVMLALYHTGRLGEEMFRHPQSTGTDLYADPDSEPGVLGYLQESRFFMDLGEINRAERYACEALAGTGDLPRILVRLGTINIVKGRPQTAEIFFKALSKKLLHCCEATQILRSLQEDPQMENDTAIKDYRRVMLTQDSVSPRMNVEVTLLRLLERNRRNKMAFDFLMAYYLLAGRPGDVVANLQYLQDFGYHGIPRHFQEAVVVHASATGDWSLTEKYDIAPEIVGQEVMLTKIREDSATEREAMESSAAAGLGSSYLFFLMYGVSGL